MIVVMMLLGICNVQALPKKPRPLYSMTMDKLILCFSGFKVKEQVVRFSVNVKVTASSDVLAYSKNTWK